MEFRKFAEKVIDKIKPFLVEKKAVATTHRCCIQLSDRNVYLVHINKTENSIELLVAQSFQYDDIGNLTPILSSLVNKYDLGSIPTIWLLSPDDYQLILIDSMPVPENEIRNALSWRVRSLINYPIDEAIIDFFMIPAKKTSPDHPMVAAISANRQQLSPTINIYKNSSIALTTIDIPELALRNLTALYENDEKSTAMIYFTGNYVILNITSKKTLYFTRRINYSFSQTHDKTRFEELSLDILRYFDYFQSQWRYPTPSRIFTASQNGGSDEIAARLSEYLMTKVEVFSLKSLLSDDKARSLLEQKLILAFGCALREGIQYVPTRD